MYVNTAVCGFDVVVVVCVCVCVWWGGGGSICLNSGAGGFCEECL